MAEDISISKKGVRNLTENEENNVEIWEDLVKIKDLVKSLIICILTTFSGYFLAPDNSYKPLLFGLVGAVTGFIISSFIIKPKRKLIKEE